jgi:poly-gamma-glutamate capsule biosynthesis protein CapA/YwtB (metallophosphatase superfamily)
MGPPLCCRCDFYFLVMIDQNLVLWDSGEGQEIATTIAIAGDFLPAGNLAFPAGVGWSQMAVHVAAYFKDVATTFVNLECAVLDGTLAPRPLTGIGQTVRAHRESLEYLRPIHAHAIGIANNHSYDFSDAGVTQTREEVSTHGMIPLGAGRTTRESPEVYVWQGPNELRIGFWAAAKASHEIATDDIPGVEPATPKRALQAVQEMKRRGSTFCVALLHVGVLRTNRPDPEDVRLMDLLAKSGFHVVACSHSHRVAGYKRIERVQHLPSFCFYGLGSLVSGYIASPLEREGLIAVAGFNRNGKFTRMEVRPVFLDESGFGSIPDTEMSHTILERFQRLSEEIADGSYEKMFYRDLSPGLFRLYIRDVRTALRHRGVRGLAIKMSRIRLRHVRRLVRKATG